MLLPITYDECGMGLPEAGLRRPRPSFGPSLGASRGKASRYGNGRGAKACTKLAAW